MPKLTKTFIDNIEITDKETWFPDSELEGFGVRVRPTGVKTYVVRYRVADNTQRKQTISKTSVMPPDKARELARKIFTLVAQGLDPLKAQRETVIAPTVEELTVRYMKDHARPFKKKNSVANDEKNIRLYVIPNMGTKKVREITKTHVLELHGSLSEKPATANQVLALLSKMFNLAEDWDYRDQLTNPCTKVKKYETKEKELILNVQQIRRLSAAVDGMEKRSEITTGMANLTRLLMLTGCRLREIMHAKMAWVDRDRNLLLLPDSKVGQRKIPLSEACMAIIDSMDEKQEWLIPGKKADQPMITPYKAWARIRDLAEIPTELRFHDLRHTAGSLAHLSGASQKEIQILLGHKQISTTERYLHGHSNTGQTIADKMSGVISAAMAAPQASPAA